MLKVLKTESWDHVPQGYTCVVELSDGRQFTVTNNSGIKELLGVPDESDVLFWKEWRRMIDVQLGETPEPGEMEAYGWTNDDEGS